MKPHSLIPILLLFLFILPIFPLILADLKSDTQALLDFAAAFPHSQKLNWNSANPVCTSWVGVTCNLNGSQVIAIHIPAVGLRGTIPANSIGRLHTLRVLSLRSNHLNGNLPTDITSISSLQFLYLQHNNFSGQFPTSLSTKLNVLDISFNSFSGSIPLTFQNLTRLTVLNLQNNSISGAIPRLNLPKLKLLNVSYNNLNGSIPFSLQNFTSSSFEGNFLLCGPPLKHCSTISPSPSYLPPSPTISQNQKSIPSKKFGIGSIIAVAIGGSTMLFLLVLMIFVCCLKRTDDGSKGILKGKASRGGKNEKPKDFGSGGFSRSFGKGSYGTAYKAVLDEGTEVLGKGSKSNGKGVQEGASRLGFKMKISLGSKGIAHIHSEGCQVAMKHQVLQCPTHPRPRWYLMSGARCGCFPNGCGLLSVRNGTEVFDVELLDTKSEEEIAELQIALAWSQSCLTAPPMDQVVKMIEEMPIVQEPPSSESESNETGVQDGRSPVDWDSRVKISLGTAKGIALNIHSGGIKVPSVAMETSSPPMSYSTQDHDGSGISDVGLTPLMNFPATLSRT
uniref:Leucine-rich repeat-containing N-terminal plant-type domain-containing protein n=1 Tax=Fagus sylvatica TaxID=28930 RepID=A0A2N9EI14_FAGSY